MSSQNQHQDPAPDPGTPSNRAERRARRKGKASKGEVPKGTKSDQSRPSQLVAQPRYKGRRGNR